jgi:hypothetical protein
VSDLFAAFLLLGGVWAMVWIVCRRSDPLADDPVGEQFRSAPRERDYFPAASLTPDEVATLADLERRLRASNEPYIGDSHA